MNTLNITCVCSRRLKESEMEKQMEKQTEKQTEREMEKRNSSLFQSIHQQHQHPRRHHRHQHSLFPIELSRQSMCECVDANEQQKGKESKSKQVCQIKSWNFQKLNWCRHKDSEIVCNRQIT